MDESLSEWLRRRESADAVARSSAVTRAAVDALPGGEALRILDLATGRGSNIRFLAGRLPGPQQWLAVDRSPALLDSLREVMTAWGEARGCRVRNEASRYGIRGVDMACDIETREVDLGRLDRDEIFVGRHLVTASALLDLVSESWLQALAARCRDVGAVGLFTITYNGRCACVPAEPEDDMVRDLMNLHQKGDKGLGGPAAGPDASACAERSFLDVGYRVRREPSDWVLTSEDADVQRTLIEGWAEAATEMGPDRGSVISDWRARRLAHVDAGRSRLTVGHDDLAAWPTRG
ncbi:MAG: class I SAM-dependent methyltransferase [Acidobacteria bacterium]|nr:class I SAM-dependent methyltransferase [Acidobacteriota bacterium]